MFLINLNNIALMAGTALVFLLVMFIIIFVILYSKAQLSFKLEKQQLQQELLKTEIEIREQTLNNVSQELHDNLGQIAVLLKMNLKQLPFTSENEHELKQAHELVQQLINDIKDISFSLQNHSLSEAGLKEAIMHDCERIKKLNFIQLETYFTEKVLYFSETTSIFLFRMFQEAINNSISHAKASKLKLSLQQEGNHIQLNISDNGIGFSRNEIKTGNGLVNLEKRAKAIDADFSIKSEPGSGTSVTIVLPYNHINHE